MEVRQIQPDDVTRVAEVERIAWGDNAAPAEVIAERARVFAPGSIVVLRDGEIVGYAAAQLTDHLSTGSWAEQTDDGRISRTHVPDGHLAYGVSMSACPGVGGKGVAAHVIEHYVDMFLGGGCRGLCLGSRVPGYKKWREANPDGALRDYLSPGPDGRPRDPELRLYAANGFKVLWEMPDYYPDERSGGHGAMILRTEA